MWRHSSNVTGVKHRYFGGNVCRSEKVYLYSNFSFCLITAIWLLFTWANTLYYKLHSGLAFEGYLYTAFNNFLFQTCLKMFCISYTGNNNIIVITNMYFSIIIRKYSKRSHISISKLRTFFIKANQRMLLFTLHTLKQRI